MALRFESNVEPVPGYRLIDRIGSGGFGEVWKCEAPGGIFKAVKIIHGDLRSQDNDLVRYAEQELKSLKRVKMVRHPYLLALDRYDIVEGRLLIVMELADCNLWDRFRQCRSKGLPGIPRAELMLYMTETAEVLDLMNVEHGLLHLDIKPQNIFLQYNHVKVGDFGQVKDLEGVATSVTGGITPVYAAPETFDGIVTRYCDQYSLAIVYQELLTGQRPFDGTSMNQLLMQHLTAAPNLAPSPAHDRPALSRALAKKSDERFTNCLDFVRALKHASEAAETITVPLERVATGSHAASNSSRIEINFADAHTGGSSVAGQSVGFGSSGYPMEANNRNDTPFPSTLADIEPILEAPAEVTGEGNLRPTLVIGLGGTGLKAVQRFKKTLADRFGSLADLPAIRTLYIDTDPDALESASLDRVWEGLAALSQDEICAAKLNRPTHYLKARLNGRTLTEGWFDPQLLHRLPRSPVTLGLRPLGRLAFCDHYRTIVQRIITELQTCTHVDAIRDTLTHSGLELQTNRPKIYLVASLAGGTGSGMLFDLAYTLRSRLKQLGYTEPNICAVLTLPVDDASGTLSSQLRANVFASLTELNHFSHPESSFDAHYDDRFGQVRDSASPFTETVLLGTPAPPIASAPPQSVPNGYSSGSIVTPSTRRMPTAGSGASRSYRNAPPSATKSGHHLSPLAQLGPVDRSTLDAAEYLRLSILGCLATVATAARPDVATIPGTVVRTFGLSRYDWPRGDVIDRTARVLSGVVIDHWVSPDFSRLRERIPGWVSEQALAFGLTLDQVLGNLARAIDYSLGEPLSERIEAITQSSSNRGWMSRAPSPEVLTGTLNELTKLLGSPATARLQATLEDTLRSTASDLAETGLIGMTGAVHQLIDNSEFRLAGAEETLQQVLSFLARSQKEAEAEAKRSHSVVAMAYEVLINAARSQKSLRRATAAEIANALRDYPTAQVRAAIFQRAAKFYSYLVTAFTGPQTEISTCRQRIQALQSDVVLDLEKPAPPVGTRQLMPAGCPTIEDAADRFLAVLNDSDLHELERWVQLGIERSFGGLYRACLNSAAGTAEFLNVIRMQARRYLNVRLGEIDLSAMFAARYPSPSDAQRAMVHAYHDAAPKLLGSGPWSKSGLTILGAPPETAGDDLRRFADDAFPEDDRTLYADTTDEVIVYREYSYVPLTALAQFGPAWVASYMSAQDTIQCTPHSRTDITEWVGVDSD